MKNHKLLWVVTIGFSFLGIVFPLLFSLFVVKNRQDASQPLQDSFVALSEKGIIEQTFIAQNDFINIIMLNFKNPNFADKGDFLFSLKSSDGQLLVEMPFSGYNIGDPSTVRFQFEPISLSKNKKFIFSIKSVSSGGVTISMASSKKKGFNYAVYYRTVNKKSEAIDLIGRLFKGLLSDPLFLVFWLLLLFLTVWTKIKFSKKE
ncbi:hypothetical protein COS55_00205 [Candidatus Shapirobacteria bacterium CG03_land_8_20_14_0_80_40_19]|uniref:Uncharacterized protein n=3 Tax=Candidatus Shapironibacteriota TaxID=1752721 RepID=A0A2M7BGG8_9BACT|nr:MAG: hypothetical protein COV89_00095 [Candidatus Shapirobacteria bacterium CG11_big_fil_rev_8_21_14_0_20_40_12]PIV02179.1 MAG: hypothetical protein COS55_00205 [Candidatus Shapirobacteria bacterium CG03_land_8_20_14_0_80_40_19]PJC77494.1 MAG: hypothetical protein CO010_00420 [Candidatus Shapirobacteria bacterium CG_4_8_14_3_um_filter_39_11]